MRNIFGDQGNMEGNFWEQGNSVKMNFGEHLNLFLRNKGRTLFGKGTFNGENNYFRTVAETSSGAEYNP